MAASRNRQATLGVPQHKLHLVARHPGEPLQKIIDPRAPLEILKQRSYGHARALEQPLAADLPCHAFHRGTLAPIKHLYVTGAKVTPQGLQFAKFAMRPTQAGIGFT
jgi:hypothetical protein